MNSKALKQYDDSSAELKIRQSIRSSKMVLFRFAYGFWVRKEDLNGEITWKVNSDHFRLFCN